MTSTFAEIKIVGLDDKSSRRSDPASALVSVVLELSASAPYEWANYFNQRWEQHFYMMKRRARVTGRRLEIECLLQELEEDHLPELKKVIAETNRAYAQFHAARTREREAEAERQADETRKLRELKNKLKFD